MIPPGIHYTAWFVVLTVQSTSLTQHYNFTTIQLGLSYLANGFGSIVGSVGCGRFLSYYYQRQVAKFTENWVKTHGKDIPPDFSHFNIVRARLTPCFWLSPIMAAACIVFGWTLDKHVHWAVPVLMTLVISFTGVSFVNMAQTLMVDFFPTESSSATASVNFVRCLLCVVGLAVIDRMVQAMGVGGAITLIAGISILSLGAFYFEYLYGQKWNEERMAKTKMVNSALYN